VIAHHPSPSLLHAARDAIFKAWLPRIGEIEARKEAERFARRFEISNADRSAAA
jgi:hypothetical protein